MLRKDKIYSFRTFKESQKEGEISNNYSPSFKTKEEAMHWFQKFTSRTKGSINTKITLCRRLYEKGIYSHEKIKEYNI